MLATYPQSRFAQPIFTAFPILIIITEPLQNWRSGSSAENRIYNFHGKCGGLPTAATTDWFFQR
jgi:hypothetical protein